MKNVALAKTHTQTRITHSHKDDTASSQQKRHTIILRITQALICVVILQSCKLLLIPSGAHALHQALQWHILNLLLHIGFFLAVIYKLKQKQIELAKYILLLSFFTYISVAACLWKVDVHLQFYFLLSMFISCYLFDQQQKYFLFGLVVLQVLLFLVFQYSLPAIHQHSTIAYGQAAQQFLDDMLMVNSAVFVLSCVICTFFIRHVLIENWQQLQCLKNTQDALLDKLFPSQLTPKLLSRNTPETATHSSAHLGVIFVDICDFTSMSCTNLSNSSTTLDWQTTYKLFSIFDAAVHKFNAKRIKTNGDQYILLVGLHAQEMHTQDGTSQKDICKQTLHACKILRDASFVDIKIGAAFGLVRFGVFDVQCPNFDIWGETVIRAARLEACAKKNEICADDALFRISQLDSFYKIQQHTLKGIGKQNVHYL
jgi:class 3 adenylate cyclase